MIVISDTSIIIGLIITGRIDLLTELFSDLIIPCAVKEELLLLLDYQEEVHSFINHRQIKVKEISNYYLFNDLSEILDRGEAEAISLAIELNADLLLIDEKKGRIIAGQFDLTFTGLLGILLLAKQKGYIESVKEIMNDLIIKQDFGLAANYTKES